MSRNFAYVGAKKFVENLGGFDPDEDWTRDSTETIWDIGDKVSNKLDDVNTKEYDDFESIVFSKPIVPGQTYYMLYAIYSSGDSFGHDESACFEIMGLFFDEETAKKCRTMLLDDSNKDTSCQAVNENDVEYTVGFVPWLGYFESLVELEIKPVIGI